MKLRLIAATLLSLSLALPSAPVLAGAPLSANTLFKGESNSAVYWYATDGKRYVFPTEGTYYSWFADFSTVRTVLDSDVSLIPIGGNVTYRPGSKLLKITTDPRTYVVTKGGYLRMLGSESVASSLYGSAWAKQVHDLPDAFFVNYKIGSPIYSYSDVNISNEYNGVTNPSDSIFATGTPGTPSNGTTSVTLNAGRNSINEGESVSLNGNVVNAPSYGYRLELIDFRNGSVVRTCDNITYCDTTVYPYRTTSGQTSVQYFIALKRTSDGVEVMRQYSPVIYFNGSSTGGVFSSGSSSLASNKTSINNGDTITLTGTVSNVNVADSQLRMEFYRERDNALLYTCYDARTCNYTFQVNTISGSNSERYYIIVKNDNNEQIPAASSQRISIANVGNNGSYTLNTTVSKTTITNNENVNFTVQLSNAPSSNYRLEIYNQNGSLRTSCYQTSYCYLSEVVTNNGSPATYVAYMKDANNTLLGTAYFPAISFNGSNNSYTLSATVNKTTLASGDTATFTAQLTNAPSGNYRIEIYDQNGNVRTTCSQTTYCYLTDTVTKNGSQATANYYAYVKDTNNNVLASSSFPTITFSGASNNVVTLTGTTALTISPSGTRPAYSQVSITANVTNYNVATNDLTVRIWAGSTPSVVQTCTNTSTCTATYSVGAAGITTPVYMSVTATNASNGLLSPYTWITTN